MPCLRKADGTAISCTTTYQKWTGQPIHLAGSKNPLPLGMGSVNNIPVNYNGIMGVPVSFMSKYNPEQFEIVGEFHNGSDNIFDLAKPIINGKQLFARIAIRRINSN